MKPKKLEWLLAELQTFDEPKVKLEQYATSPEMAVSIASAVSRLCPLGPCSLVADLGCGCGILGIAVAASDANVSVIGVDIDEDALAICKENVETADLDDRIDLLHCDVLLFAEVVGRRFDVVITNPPFGTKYNSGLDLSFVRAGLSVLNPGGSVFSLHKTSTRAHILKTANSWEGVKAECVAQLRWDLPATYKFHKKKSVDIDVDLIQYKRE